MDIITEIETDLKAAWGELVGVVETDAKILWADFKGIVTALVPEQYSILTTFIARALADVEGGNIDDIETALLNLAEVQELAWVKELGSEVLQAIIAVAKASAPKAAA